MLQYNSFYVIYEMTLKCFQNTRLYYLLFGVAPPLRLSARELDTHTALETVFDTLESS
jgi:hypothetical protein